MTRRSWWRWYAQPPRIAGGGAGTSDLDGNDVDWHWQPAWGKTTTHLHAVVASDEEGGTNGAEEPYSGPFRVVYTERHGGMSGDGDTAETEEATSLSSEDEW